MKLKTRAQKLIDAAPFLKAYKTFMKAWRNPFWRKKNKFDDVIYVVPIVTQQYSIPCITHRFKKMKDFSVEYCKIVRIYIVPPFLWLISAISLYTKTIKANKNFAEN